MDKVYLLDDGTVIQPGLYTVNHRAFYKAFYGVRHVNWVLLKAEVIADNTLAKLIESADKVVDLSAKKQDHDPVLLVIENGPFQTKIRRDK